MNKFMNLHFNIYRKEINTWQMTLLFFSFCHVLAPVVKCIRFVQLNEHYWYMNNLSDTCNIVGAWRRVFPSVRGGDWGDPTTTQKIGLSPHAPRSFSQKCWFCIFHVVFGYFAQIVPRQVDLMWETLWRKITTINFSVNLFLLIESSLRLVSA